jgi:hypothetical protein
MQQGRHQQMANGHGRDGSLDYSRMLGGSFFPMKLLDLILDVEGVLSAQLITITIAGLPIKKEDYEQPRELGPDESLYLDTKFLDQNMTVRPPNGSGTER